jgi:hypothetical protein
VEGVEGQQEGVRAGVESREEREGRQEREGREGREGGKKGEKEKMKERLKEEETAGTAGAAGTAGGYEADGVNEEPSWRGEGRADTMPRENYGGMNGSVARVVGSGRESRRGPDGKVRVRGGRSGASTRVSTFPVKSKHDRAKKPPWNQRTDTPVTL